MSVPYDYDQSSVEHLRAVIAEQERTIDYLHERCKAEEVENAKLRELMYSRAHRFALQNMTEDELRIVATNLLEQINKYRELVSVMSSEFAEMSHCYETPCGECPVKEECEREEVLLHELGFVIDD